MTVGPWKPILVHSYQSRISDADIRTIYKADSDSFALNINVEITPPTTGEVTLTLLEVDQTATLKIDEKGHAVGQLELKQGAVEKWYPIGYGEAKLYELNVIARDQVRQERSRQMLVVTFSFRTDRLSMRSSKRLASGMSRWWRTNWSTKMA
jgi:hypothetical protein